MQTTTSTCGDSTRPGGIERQVLLEGRRNNQCWFSPSIAAIPTAAGMQVVVNVHQLSGNDYGPIHTLHVARVCNPWPAHAQASACNQADQAQGVTSDRASAPDVREYTNHGLETRATGWCPPFESQNLHKIPLDDDVFESVHTLGMMHHRKSGRTFGFGGTVFTRDRNVNPLFKTEWFVSEKAMEISGALAWWNADRGDFEPWRKFDVPQIRGTPTPTLPRSTGGGGEGSCPLVFGLNQCCELEDGSILMPVGEYRADKTASVTTIKLQIEGDGVKVERVGTQIGHKLFEPSIVEFDGRFYLTIRSEQRDGRMYHSTSSDGLSWGEPVAWEWDDGTPVETAQTQQHWMKLGGTLFLVYTRKSELNNGVFRYRAPLYMARVQVTDRPRLVRESEQIVFPEKGARMGNFSVCSISDDESWIVTGEWLQQWIEGYRPDQVGWVDSGDDPFRYNRLIYRGDLLLAKVRV